MSTTSSVVVLSRRDIVLARLAAYFELSKPRIAALVLVVVAVSPARRSLPPARAR